MVVRNRQIIEITHRKKDLRSFVVSLHHAVRPTMLRHLHIDGQRGHLFLSFRKWVKAFGDVGTIIGKTMKSSLFLYPYFIAEFGGL